MMDCDPGKPQPLVKYSCQADGEVNSNAGTIILNFRDASVAKIKEWC